MAHIRRRTGYVLIVLLLRQVCDLLLRYRDYQSTIQTTLAMDAWDGLFTACEVFMEVVVDPRTMTHP